jgi:hypothetical protein
MPRDILGGFFLEKPVNAPLMDKKTQKVSIIGGFLIKWRESFVYGILKF